MGFDVLIVRSVFSLAVKISHRKMFSTVAAVDEKRN